jgi:hypothetical protein
MELRINSILRLKRVYQSHFKHDLSRLEHGRLTKRKMPYLQKEVIRCANE